MARATSQKARTDIYLHGKRVEANNKKGYRIDRSQPSGEGDVLVVHKGEIYWKWQFMNGPVHVSATRPLASQLTNSPYKKQVLQWEENPLNYSEELSFDDVRQWLEDRVSEVESLRDETQDSLDNMPYQLQEAPTGELLQERIDALEQAINEYESIDVDSHEEEANDDNVHALEQLVEEVNAVIIEA